MCCPPPSSEWRCLSWSDAGVASPANCGVRSATDAGGGGAQLRRGRGRASTTSRRGASATRGGSRGRASATPRRAIRGACQGPWKDRDACSDAMDCGDPMACGDPTDCGGPIWAADCGDPMVCGGPVDCGGPLWTAAISQTAAIPQCAAAPANAAAPFGLRRAMDCGDPEGCSNNPADCGRTT